jgi:hypothetical protein
MCPKLYRYEADMMLLLSYIMLYDDEENKLKIKSRARTKPNQSGKKVGTNPEQVCWCALHPKAHGVVL